MKFLIIRFSSIGDIVLTTPVIRGIKQQVDGAVVHYLTKPQYASILESNPYVDKVHTLNSFQSTINELKDEGFDYLIDLHKNIRTYIFKHKLKVLDFSFHKYNKEKWLLVNFKKNNLPNKHIVDRYLESVSVFDVNNDGMGLDYFIPDNISYNIKDKLIISEPYVAFAIGGQHETKKLPAENIKELCQGINAPLILLGGKEDFENGEIISKDLKNVINLCGKTSLDESAHIVRQSSIVISHDTGLMHIAAAFKKNIVSIWGNTIPEFGMYPYLPGENSKIFEVKNLKCRPCSKIGHAKCPKKHFDCMKKQNFKEIIEHVNKFIGND
ncbi:MAG: glycosyl transferase [Marinilabiliales bacterium]|nr:MAG: glycosyl transferase [Marinilabiliales bacterium]